MYFASYVTSYPNPSPITQCHEGPYLWSKASLMFLAAVYKKCVCVVSVWLLYYGRKKPLKGAKRTSYCPTEQYFSTAIVTISVVSNLKSWFISVIFVITLLVCSFFSAFRFSSSQTPSFIFIYEVQMSIYVAVVTD